MEILIEIVGTLILEIIGGAITEGIAAGKEKRRKKRGHGVLAVEKKKQVIIKFETKRRIWISLACFYAVVGFGVGFGFSMDKWQKGNAPASLPIAVGIGMAVLTLAAILVFVWINIYKIILDSEKFTIVYGIFPRRKIMHKELENITVEKREKLGDKAVVLCFYVGGKRRVRFISSDVDYDKAKELLDNLKAINSI